MGGLLTLPDALPSPFRLVIFLRVKTAAEVLCLPALRFSSLAPRLPKVVDVWPIGLELSGSEGDSLFKGEQPLMN